MKVLEMKKLYADLSLTERSKELEMSHLKTSNILKLFRRILLSIKGITDTQTRVACGAYLDRFFKNVS